MFNSENPRIGYSPRDTISPPNDFRLSNKGTNLTITSTNDNATTSLTFTKEFASNKNFYYEAKMTGSNNSIAVGLISFSFYASRFFEDYDSVPMRSQAWASEIRDLDLIVGNGWPRGASYTYHGDTGKVWHNNTSPGGGDFLKVGDTVGWGIDGVKSELYFTVNGSRLDTYYDIKGLEKFHPHIALKGDGAQLELNYGREPFVYKPKEAKIKLLPEPESFSEEWMKQIGNNEELPHTLMYDFLRDVTIVSKDGVEIKCHGLVLATRSPVFRAMMDPANKGRNIIPIKDFDSSTISKMLWFMYSDKVKADNVDMELLGISNMYQVEALQVVCEKHLSKELVTNNVLDAWLGAHLFKRELFLELCEKFIISNWEDVQKTDSFSKILRENSQAMATLTIKMLNNIKASSEE